MEMSMTPLIEAVGIDKAFGAVQSLQGVSIRGDAGSAHAVTGENGAGKSTLMKIIAGVVRRDAGIVKLRGKEVSFRNPVEATLAGISTVFQEFSLVPNLSVAETLWLGREPLDKLRCVDRTLLRRSARQALDQVGLNIDPRRLVNTLTVAEQQAVEIAKGLSVDADVFILDEPTAALNSAEVERLELLIAAMKARGKCIFYISHRMREIFDICDTVTVLKDGRFVTSLPTCDVDATGLLKLMVGRDVQQLFPPRSAECGEALLQVRDLRVGQNAPPVSFDIRKGEIVALAGLEGQGQREIIRCISGVMRPASGKISLPAAAGPERALPANVRARIASGFGFMPEDRKAEGLYLDLSVTDNIALGRYQKRSVGRIARSLTALVDTLAKDLAIKARDPQSPVSSLSGGNQQKVMLARWLASGARVLLIEEPTRGVDVGAKAELYAILRRFADAGNAVLVTSRELLEAIGLSDRLLVVRELGIAAEMASDEASEETVLLAAAGIPHAHATHLQTEVVQ